MLTVVSKLYLLLTLIQMPNQQEGIGWKGWYMIKLKYTEICLSFWMKSQWKIDTQIFIWIDLDSRYIFDCMFSCLSWKPLRLETDFVRRASEELLWDCAFSSYVLFCLFVVYGKNATRHFLLVILVSDVIGIKIIVFVEISHFRIGWYYRRMVWAKKKTKTRVPLSEHRW